MFSTLNLNRLSRFLWGAALVTLPVTSFRYFPFLDDNTYVRPLSLYPLALLLPVLIVQWLRRVRSFPWAGSALLLAVFILAVLFASSLGAVFDPILLRGQNYLSRAVRAWAALIIGIIFFASAAWMNRDEVDLKFTVKWLLVGFGFDLVWSGLQAVTFYTPLLEKEMVTHWQLAFSMRELVRTNRISGLAYEPSWLAGQIASIYAPILFGSLLTGFHLAPRMKWLEPALLILSLLLLFATYSRGGILITLGAAALTFLFVGRAASRAAWKWFVSGFRTRLVVDGLLRLGLLLALAGVVVGAFTFLSQKNYFRRLWEISADSIGEYIIDINAGARGAYAAGALQAFEDHPLTGVGLGASGFHIYQNLPDWSLTTVPEIARQLNPANRLYPNPKNMYVRLLAEIGLIGFVLFLVFQFSILGDTLVLLPFGGWPRFLGVAGLFAWLAIGLYNGTQDSFAVPNIWIIPGMLAGISNSFSSLTPLQKEQGKEN